MNRSLHNTALCFGGLAAFPWDLWACGLHVCVGLRSCGLRVCVDLRACGICGRTQFAPTFMTFFMWLKIFAVRTRNARPYNRWDLRRFRGILRTTGGGRPYNRWVLRRFRGIYGRAMRAPTIVEPQSSHDLSPRVPVPPAFPPAHAPPPRAANPPRHPP